MAFSLASFDLHEMLRCGLDLRRSALGAATLEEAADAVTRYLYDQFVDPATGEREAALVRFYKTHSFGALPDALQAAARARASGHPCSAEMKCLVLLASAGLRPEWNRRQASVAHQAIPLASVDMVERAPMIAQLVRAMGLEVHDVVAPGMELMGEGPQRTYDVFFVPEALGSPYIPAQREFVEPYGIRSVIGFGGVLRSGELAAVILFSRVPVTAAAATRFRNLALDVKLSVSALPADAVFRPAPEVDAGP